MIISSVSDTGTLRKRKSEFSQQGIQPWLVISCFEKEATEVDVRDHVRPKYFVCYTTCKTDTAYCCYSTLTTALLSGGWVPVIPRSFHYWQPAPRWRPLPWLGNPAMSPHATGKKAGTHRTENISRKREGRRREETAYKLSHNVCDTPTLNKAC